MPNAQNSPNQLTTSTRAARRPPLAEQPLNSAEQDLPKPTTTDHHDQIGPAMTNTQNSPNQLTTSTRSVRRLPLAEQPLTALNRTCQNLPPLTTPTR